MKIHGEVEEAKASLPNKRFFTWTNLKQKKAYMKEIASELNKKYGEGTVEVEISDTYYNMRKKN